MRASLSAYLFSVRLPSVAELFEREKRGGQSQADMALSLSWTVAQPGFDAGREASTGCK